jgi:hypothetical protein
MKPDMQKEIKRQTALVKIIVFLVFGTVIVFTLLQKPKLTKEAEEYFREVTLRTYGGAKADAGWNILNSGDGYVAAGDTASSGQGSTDAYLIKTNYSGSLLWTRTFGDTGAESGIALCETRDNGYLMAGGSTSFGSGETDAYAVKTDKDGEKIWDMVYGGKNYDYVYSVCPATGEGYVMTGYSSSFGAGLDSDVYLIKIDEQGKKLWEKTYGGSGWDTGYSVIESGTNGYMIAGYTTSTGLGKSDMYVVKVDANGNCLWAHSYGGGREDRAVCIIRAEDGGYIVAGKSQSYTARGFGWDIILMKISEDGRELWNRPYPAAEAEIGNCLIRANNGGYIMAGTKKCYGMCDSNIYVIRTDAEGNSAWVRVFSGKNNEFANSICRAEDKGYVILGTTLSYGYGRGDIFMLKIDENGEKVW